MAVLVILAIAAVLCLLEGGWGDLKDLVRWLREGRTRREARQLDLEALQNYTGILEKTVMHGDFVGGYVDTGFTPAEYEAFGLADNDRFLLETSRTLRAQEDRERHEHQPDKQAEWARLTAQEQVDVYVAGRPEPIRRDGWTPNLAGL